MQKISAVAAMAGLVAGLGFAAQASAYSVAHRSHVEQARINQGASSGRLSSGEASRLQYREHAINKSYEQDKAANGGELTRDEKIRLGARQAALGASTAADKHNGVSAPPQ